MKLLGRQVEVLVEGPSKWSQRKKEEGPIVQMTGRTPCDRIVVWQGNQRQAGQLLPINIYDVSPFTLFGSVVTVDEAPDLVSLELSVN
jgi:tRNA-2-methylthio-N6-dimethylallyladenosine synthase